MGLVTHVSTTEFTIHPDSGPDVTYHADFIKSMLADKGKPQKQSQKRSNDWPETNCKECDARIILVKTGGRWCPYDPLQFRPHRCL
ncbi:MAG TPA: hypothetical protein VLT36_21625 [Candidatus Dormibacteraeota bacterium]|nr:hypothetical protein [Candidatus Dormibacteraeota bacterium]